MPLVPRVASACKVTLDAPVRAALEGTVMVSAASDSELPGERERAPLTVRESVPPAPETVRETAGFTNETLSMVPVVLRTRNMVPSPGSTSSTRSSSPGLPATVRLSIGPLSVIGSRPAYARRTRASSR